jgi:hypothetical protein
LLKSLLCFYKTWVQKRLRFFYRINAILGFSNAMFQNNVFAVLGGQTIDTRDHRDNLVFAFKKSSKILSVKLNFILIHKTKSFYLVKLFYLLIQFMTIRSLFKFFVTSFIFQIIVIFQCGFFNLLIFIHFLHLLISLLFLFSHYLILNILMSVFFLVFFLFIFIIF